jgi:hypothetical protein
MQSPLFFENCSGFVGENLLKRGRLKQDKVSYLWGQQKELREG